MRNKNVYKGIAELSLLLLLVFLLVFSISNLRFQQPFIAGAAATSYPAPLVQTSTPVLKNLPYPPPGGTTPTPILQSSALPSCKFNLFAGKFKDNTAPSLERYIFNSPQIAFKSDLSFELAQWLPDNTNLLVTYAIGGQSSKEEIAVVDLSKNELRKYSVRNYNSSVPVWVAATNSIYFTNRMDSQNYGLFSIPFQPSGLSNVTLLATLPSEYFTPIIGGKLAAFSSDSKKAISILRTDTLQSQSQEISFNWASKRSGLQPNRLAWNEFLNIVAINDPTGLFLLDIGSGNACSVDLGKYDEEKLWPYYVKWSQDGKYLAMLTTIGSTPIHTYMDLEILDVGTGVISSISSINNLDNTHYFVDISWAPDGRTLATVKEVDNKDAGLYLIDATTGKILRVLNDYSFHFGDIGRNISWSSDGIRIVFKCLNGPLCITEIEH